MRPGIFLSRESRRVLPRMGHGNRALETQRCLLSDKSLEDVISRECGGKQRNSPREQFDRRLMQVGGCFVYPLLVSKELTTNDSKFDEINWRDLQGDKARSLSTPSPKATVGGTADRKVPALQPSKSQGDYYRQQDPTEVPPSQDPGIDDSTKPVNNDSCADDPMSRHLRAHPWRSDKQTATPAHATALQCRTPRISSRSRSGSIRARANTRVSPRNP
jgi:hypothetical protein